MRKTYSEITHKIPKHFWIFSTSAFKNECYHFYTQRHQCCVNKKNTSNYLCSHMLRVLQLTRNRFWLKIRICNATKFYTYWALRIPPNFPYKHVKTFFKFIYLQSLYVSQRFNSYPAAAHQFCSDTGVVNPPMPLLL